MNELIQLDASALSAVMAEFSEALNHHRQEINRLNVYPVPDGDTGTNMALTLESVMKELNSTRPASNVDEGEGSPSEMARICKAISHGSLMGARGNSGVILSQILRGIADRFKSESILGAKEVAEALVNADLAARDAVMRPVEGTILTVAARAAEAAMSSARRGESLLEVVSAARDASIKALRDTPKLLPILAQAGVVDAGGAGLFLLFDSLYHYLAGISASTEEQSAVIAPELTPAHSGATKISSPGITGTLDDYRAGEVGPSATDQENAQVVYSSAREGEPSSDIGGKIDLGYEVMFLLEAPDSAIDAFKDVWAGIGESIVVVGGDGLWNCHIHTDDVGAAIEAGIDVGRPRNIRVVDLSAAVEEERWVREGANRPDAGINEELAPTPVTAVVAVGVGEGVRRIFRSLGVHKTVMGGQTMNPSVAELVNAVEEQKSKNVIILPNNSNIIPVAEQVVAVSKRSVAVVPTTSITEGFAALLAYDPEAELETNTRSMQAAAEHVLSAEVTRAVRDADSPAGAIKAGDWIGMSKTGIEAVGTDLAETACSLLAKLISPDHELVTVIEGEGASPASTRHLTEWLADQWPDIAVEVHHGGQPLYPYLFGIE